MNDGVAVDRPGSDRRSGLLGDILIGWLPFLIGCISIPMAIYVPNLIEFGYELSVIFPFLGLGALFFLALFATALFPTRWRVRICSALFFVGVFLLVSDMAVPLRWGLLDGGSVLTEPLRATLLELGLALVLIACWIKLPTPFVRGFGVPLTLVLLATQLFNLGLAVKESSEHEAAQSGTAGTTSSRPTAATSGTRGNIYHVVFDGYSGLRFEEAVRRLDLKQVMSGFTFFERTLANYQITDASVPSFLLGRFFQDGSFKEWQESARQRGLRRWLDDAGMQINIYSPDRARFWMYDGASYVRTSKEISKTYFRGSDSFRLAQVAMVRAAPNILRHEIFWLSDRLFGYVIAFLNDMENPGAFSHYGFYKRLSVPLIRQFMEEEKARDGHGNYVYVHVLLPHSPFVWNGECAYASRSDYDEQTLCATRFMGEIVDLLKELGRYDDALIIFQSDHGYQRVEGGDSNLEFKPPQAVKDTVRAAMTYIDIDGYFRRIHSLLAIKPPNAGTAPLRVSRAPAQLIDIPATVADLMGIDAPVTDGTSVFGLDEGAPREIHLYAGVYTTAADGSPLVLGNTMSETELAHVSYTPSKGWTVYPNLPVRAE